MLLGHGGERRQHVRAGVEQRVGAREAAVPHRIRARRPDSAPRTWLQARPHRVRREVTSCRVAGRLRPPSFVGFRPAWVRGDVVAGLDGVGGARPRVARLRHDRRGPTRRRSLRRRPRPGALRAGRLARDTSSSRRCRPPPPCRSASSRPTVATTAEAVVAHHRRSPSRPEWSPGGRAAPLGFLASFISEPVLKGFIIGLALTIMIGQLPGHDRRPQGQRQLLREDVGPAHPPRRHRRALGRGRRRQPRRAARPAPLDALRARLADRRRSIGIAAVDLLGLDDDGLDIVGHIQSGLPDLGLPDVSGRDFLDAARRVRSASCWSASPRDSARPRRTPRARGTTSTRTASSLGLGVANLGAGLASGMVVNGSLSKTAVNGAAGAKSQISGLTAAVLTVVTLLFLTGLFEKLPEATLAAIVVAAVVELVDIASLRGCGGCGPGGSPACTASPSRVDFFAAARDAARRPALRHPARSRHRHRRVPGPADRPHVATAPAVLVPVPRSGDAPSTQAQIWVDSERNPDIPAVAGLLVVRVEAPCSMFTNADVVREQIRDLVADSDPRRPWSCSTAAPPRRSTSPPPPCWCSSVRT